MTDTELIAEQQAAIKALQRRVRKLVKRLKEKKKYEAGLLLNCGCTPKYIFDIDEKDRKALEE